MTCSATDLKDYFLGDIAAAERRVVEAHLGTCGECRDELDALRMTRNALMTVGDEEPPRRIAFVSDKVFEPTLWQRVWSSGARGAVASAAMLSLAVVAHGYLQRPEPAKIAVDEGAVRAEVSRRVDEAVMKAVADVEARQTERLLQAVNARERRRDVAVATQLLDIKEQLVYWQKRSGVVTKATLQMEHQ